MGEQRVRVEHDGGVAHVRLDRADKRNALDTAMFEALIEAGHSLATAPGLRAVVISGAGKDFCAGLDLALLDAMRRGERLTATLPLPDVDGPATATAQYAAHLWARLPVPVLAAITGNALGGGLQLALGADIRIVAPDARLGLLEVAWGIVPDMTGSTLLPALVGRDVALDLITTARTVSGEEAVRIGLATRCAADPLAEALATATSIAAASPHAVRAATRLNRAAGPDLAAGFAAEQTEVAALIGSPNQREAVDAGLARRAAVFVDVAD